MGANVGEPIFVTKDEGHQQPVPSIWRPTIAGIAEALCRGDYTLTAEIAGVRPISKRVANQIADNVAAYGVVLGRLPDATWNSSACQWMQGWWEVLVDLFDQGGSRTDLVISLRVSEMKSQFRYQVMSVFVP